MNGKIRVFRNKENQPFVSGLDLHNALKCQTPYRKWFRRFYNLCGVEGSDYFPIEKQVFSFDGRLMPQKQHEHYLSIPMAKRVCLFQPRGTVLKCLGQLDKISDDWAKGLYVDRRPDNLQDNIGLLRMKNDALRGEVQRLEEENRRLRVKADFFDALFPAGIRMPLPGVYVCRTDLNDGRLNMQGNGKPAGIFH